MEALRQYSTDDNNAQNARIGIDNGCVIVAREGEYSLFGQMFMLLTPRTCLNV